jgi:hypothetical protein
MTLVLALVHFSGVTSFNLTCLTAKVENFDTELNNAMHFGNHLEI